MPEDECRSIQFLKYSEKITHLVLKPTWPRAKLSSLVTAATHYQNLVSLVQ